MKMNPKRTSNGPETYPRPERKSIQVRLKIGDFRSWSKTKSKYYIPRGTLANPVTLPLNDAFSIVVEIDFEI